MSFTVHGGKGDAKGSNGLASKPTSSSGAILPGPKTPLWTCPRCNAKANWQCRLMCWNCQASSPGQVRQAALKAAQEAVRSPSSIVSVAPWREDDEVRGLKEENKRQARIIATLSASTAAI